MFVRLIDGDKFVYLFVKYAAAGVAKRFSGDDKATDTYLPTNKVLECERTTFSATLINITLTHRYISTEAICIIEFNVIISKTGSVKVAAKYFVYSDLLTFRSVGRVFFFLYDFTAYLHITTR